MKRKNMILAVAVISLLFVVSFVLANDAEVSQQVLPNLNNEKLFKALGVVGLGLAAGGGAASIGLLSKAFIEGIYRNPETTNKMLIWYFVAFALIEAQVLYTLFFVFQLFFAK